MDFIVVLVVLGFMAHKRTVKHVDRKNRGWITRIDADLTVEFEGFISFQVQPAAQRQPELWRMCTLFVESQDGQVKSTATSQLLVLLNVNNVL